MKTRKIISIIITFMMVLSTGAFIFANSLNDSESLNIETEIHKAKLGISDIPVTPELKDNIIAYYEDDKGNKIPLDVQLTISEVPQLKSNSVKLLANSERLYAVTAVASTERTSTDDGICDNSAISASGWLTMYWTDNQYPTKNTLKKIAGGWSTESSTTTIQDRKVNYGSKYSVENTYYPSRNSFEYSGLNYESQKLRTRSWAYFKDGTEKGRIFLDVFPVN